MHGKGRGCQPLTSMFFVPRRVLKIVTLGLFVGMYLMLVLVAKVTCVGKIDPFTLFKKESLMGLSSALYSRNLFSVFSVQCFQYSSINSFYWLKSMSITVLDMPDWCFAFIPPLYMCLPILEKLENEKLYFPDPCI